MERGRILFITHIHVGHPLKTKTLFFITARRGLSAQKLQHPYSPAQTDFAEWKKCKGVAEITSVWELEGVQM